MSDDVENLYEWLETFSIDCAGMPEPNEEEMKVSKYTDAIEFIEGCKPPCSFVAHINVALEALRFVERFNRDNLYKKDMAELETYRQQIKAGELVRVVRCRECWSWRKNGRGQYGCETDGDDFCRSGERREKE